MDDCRFDGVTRAIGRRGVLAGALGLAAGGPAAPDPLFAGVNTVACPKRGAGAQRRHDGQCCSGQCRTRPRKRKGTCRCSRLRQPCADNFDCCGHREGVPETLVCDDLGGFCCKNPSQPCSDAGDCCGLAFICSDANFCEHV